MDSEQAPLSAEMTPRETAQALRRILDAVEKQPRRQWVEIATVIVLSLATTASAWCAYQSSLWGGVQTFRLSAGGRAGRKASELTIAVLQYKAFDVAMFIDYIEAQHSGDTKTAQFLYERFRPEARKAIDAWLATDPFNHPDPSLGPFRMAEYVQAEEGEIKNYQDEAAKMLQEAQQANETSDTYVLLTVMFASVLFFGGIGGTFDSRRLRMTLMLIAVTLFTATVAALATMPICNE